MGQQQLLLLVIGVILVGVAVMAGFAAAEAKLRHSAVDTMVDRNLVIASEAVAWKSKRDPYNGGNAKYTGLETDGMKKLFLGERTHNAYFKITKATDDELVITAVSLAYPEVGIRTYVNGYSIDSTSIAYDGSIEP